MADVRRETGGSGERRIMDLVVAGLGTNGLAAPLHEFDLLRLAESVAVGMTAHRSSRP